VEDQFFAALVEAGLEDLDQVLADDFILVEVIGGTEVTKRSLLAAIGSGQLKCEAVEPVHSRLRICQSVAAIADLPPSSLPIIMLVP
jgi:hypothetical protein